VQVYIEYVYFMFASSCKRGISYTSADVTLLEF